MRSIRRRSEEHPKEESGVTTPFENWAVRAVIVGSALIDDVHANSGVEQYLGGTGFNLAVTLSRFGVRTALAASFAADEEGLALRAGLECSGVELLWQPDTGATRHATSHVSNGEPSYQFSDAAHRQVTFTADVMHVTGGADVTVFNSFPFEKSDAVRLLEMTLRESKGIRIIDPNPRPDLVRDAGVFAHHLDLVLPFTDIVKVSLNDLGLLYGSSDQAALERIFSGGTELVVLTRGSAGAEIVTAAGDRYTAPPVLLDALLVDTIGAGDAALAALIASVLADADARSDPRPSRPDLLLLDWGCHLGRAMAAAAKCCQHAGGPGNMAFRPASAQALVPEK
jgi:fructokinase